MSMFIIFQVGIWYCICSISSIYQVYIKQYIKQVFVVSGNIVLNDNLADDDDDDDDDDEDRPCGTC